MDQDAQETPNVQQVVPFLRVSDMEASLHYYIDGLGFTMTIKWIDEGKIRWCWLELGGAALMLQEFRQEGHDSWAPAVKVGEGVSIVFICQDALAIYREITSRGIEATRPTVGNGMWNLMTQDPDGYWIEFESITDVPEGTELPVDEGAV
ncbi:MAG: VOC family protein [Anaerolineae bacterium]|nr:VOC family protein [Anaerolineae bacterium]